MNDEARAFLIVGALIASVSGSGGFVGGRVTAPLPPAEVRYVPIPVPVAPLAEAVPIDPPAPAVVEPAPQVEPPVATAPPPIETKPMLPAPRPKVEAAPKAKPAAQPKPRPPAAKNTTLPSCAVVKREYERMTSSERWAAYLRADAAQVAYGRRCLGF